MDHHHPDMADAMKREAEQRAQQEDWERYQRTQARLDAERQDRILMDQQRVFAMQGLL